MIQQKLSTVTVQIELMQGQDYIVLIFEVFTIKILLSEAQKVFLFDFIIKVLPDIFMSSRVVFG